MEDNAGKFYISNGNIQLVDILDDYNLQNFKVVYEVIRIINKTPLFFEEHYFRMKNSILSLGESINIKEQELDKQIRKLVDVNGLSNCNVKVIVYTDLGKQHYLLYISKSYYPVKEDFERGVPLGLLHWEREKPNVKQVNHKYKELVAKKIKEDNVFEVLLVNSDDKITEGSRSNVFFVKGSKVYTSPGEYVLKGITRQYVFNACKMSDVEVIETLIGLDSLKDMEGVFISGTSIKVLPVSNIDNNKYESSKHPAIIAISEMFDKIIDEYILRNKF